MVAGSNLTIGDGLGKPRPAHTKKQRGSMAKKTRRTIRRKEGAGKKAEESKIDVSGHILVPKHEILSESEKNKLFEQYRITIKEMPRIQADDPAIVHLKAKPGDMIKITRKSPTAGTVYYYRVVSNV